MKRSLLHEAVKQCSVDKHVEHWKHWTYIVQNNKIVEYGKNYTHYNPPHFGYHKYSKVHSEVSAYIRAKSLLGTETFEIINVRLSVEGFIRLSKPCQQCFSLLKSLGCTKFYYTTNDGNFERV